MNTLDNWRVLTVCLLSSAVSLGHSPSIRRDQPLDVAKGEKLPKKTEFVSLKEKVSVAAGILTE